MPTVRALVLGGADCVWDDVRRSEELLGDNWWDIVVAANDIGCHWPRHLDGWATLHPEKMLRWRAAREANGHPGGFVSIARTGRRMKGTDVELRYKYNGGSSGLFAVVAAELHFGATRRVICGIPMEKTPHFTESAEHGDGRNWSPANSHWKEWLNNAGRLAGSVKSMSVVRDHGTGTLRPSRTRALLGPPSIDWLEGKDDARQA